MFWQIKRLQLLCCLNPNSRFKKCEVLKSEINKKRKPNIKMMKVLPSENGSPMSRLDVSISSLIQGLPFWSIDEPQQLQF
jgi:hypothetical protein